jgi:hypothetical protein
LPLKAAGANMVWPNEGRWGLGRVGIRRARDSSVEALGERSARSRSGTVSFTWNQAICERVGGDGNYHRDTIEWSDLERAVSGARPTRAVCVPGVYGAEHRWNHEKSSRPVSSFGSLRFHCYESGDPRGFFCEFDAWGSNVFDGFAQRVQSFQAASGYAEIFYCEDSDGRWHRALSSVSCASIWIEPFWLLVLEISAEILNYGQEDARLSCFELCRRLRDCSISEPPCIIGGLSKSVAANGCPSFALSFDKAPFKECLGRWLPAITSRLCGGYSPRFVWNPGEEVGCDFELFPAVADEGSTQPQVREGGLSGKYIGKAQSMRLAVPDTAFHLRALYDCVSARTTASMPLTFLGKPCRTSTRTARLSHPALKDLGFCKDLPNQLHHRPTWSEASKPTVTIHTDASMTAYGATLALGEQEAGAKDFYEFRGYWEGSHLNKAHITLLELATVRLCLKDFLQHCVLRRDAVIKLYTDNMVTMFVVNKWVSKSPVIMAELRRLHQLCKCHGLELELHHLPSALNLYADRLSRRRRV